MSLVVLLRTAGASLIALAIFHAVLAWRLRWGEEIVRLSALNARVFVVHAFVVASGLFALGLLSLLRPHLLLAPSELARLLLLAIVGLWIFRLVLQPLVFDPVLPAGPMRSAPFRLGVSLVWAFYVAVYGCALVRQWEAAGGPLTWVTPFDFHSPSTWLRLGVALVWLIFGLLFKALGAVPRHRQIVARVVGDEWAGPVLWLVALGEIGIASWMLVGHGLWLCVGVQTLAIVAMNALELRYAQDLLLSPLGMVSANLAFLSIGWYVALAAP